MYFQLWQNHSRNVDGGNALKHSDNFCLRRSNGSGQNKTFWSINPLRFGWCDDWGCRSKCVRWTYWCHWAQCLPNLWFLFWHVYRKLYELLNWSVRFIFTRQWFYVGDPCWPKRIILKSRSSNCWALQTLLRTRWCKRVASFNRYLWCLWKCNEPRYRNGWFKQYCFTLISGSSRSGRRF